MVSLNQSNLSDEIDLFKIFKVLWDGKWRILLISIFFLLIGFYYHFNQPNNYRVSFDISSGSESKFIKYIKVNDLLSTSPLLFLPSKDEEVSEENFYSITPKNVLDKFVNQFEKKYGIIASLSMQPYSDIFSFNNEAIEDKILSKSKEFTISKINNQTFNLTFNWPNINQVHGLSDMIVEQVIYLVKEDILNDLKMIKEFNASKRQNIINEINHQIQLFTHAEDDKKDSRMLFLEEQLSIAKNLNIKKHISKSDTFNTNNSTNPFFLIGFDAINQEIQKLKNRSKNNTLLLSPEYLSLTNQLREVTNDSTSERIDKAINIFINEEPKDWIYYNFSFAEISNVKKSHLYIVLSFLIGLILGSIYVLIRGNMLKKTLTN